MASEGLTCPICFERFDDQTFCPRLLSCGHSFCSGCLERLLHGNAINCPTCRNAVSAPAGVTGLPKNFALLDIVNATPQHTGDGDLHFCEACEGDQHPATSCCLDCKEDMCKVAAGFHTRSKASRDHRIVALEELKANPKLAAVSVFCPEHNDQFRFFDEDCGHVVCRDCVTLEHSGHKCVSLDKAASKYRQQMEALVTKADTHIEKIKAAEARVTGVRVDLKKAYDEDVAHIQGMFKELYAALTTREQFLMNELDQLHKTKAVILTEQQDRLRIFQACLQSVVHRAKSTIQSSSNAELLLVKSDIESTLRAIESQSPGLEPQANCMLKVTFEVRHLLDMLSNTGVVSDMSATKERQVYSVHRGRGEGWWKEIEVEDDEKKEGDVRRRSKEVKIEAEVGEKVVEDSGRMGEKSGKEESGLWWSKKSEEDDDDEDEDPFAYEEPWWPMENVACTSSNDVEEDDKKVDVDEKGIKQEPLPMEAYSSSDLEEVDIVDTSVEVLS